MSLLRKPGEFPRLNQVADMLAMSPRMLRASRSGRPRCSCRLRRRPHRRV